MLSALQIYQICKKWKKAVMLKDFYVNLNENNCNTNF